MTEVHDEKGALLLSLKDHESMIIRLTFLAKGVFTYRFSNKHSLKKHIYTVFDCKQCIDRRKSELMERKDLEKKIERLVNVQVMLGVSSVHSENMLEATSRTREHMSHKHETYLSIEAKMKVFGGIEVLVIMALSLWQVYYFKRLVLKRRFF